jgi:hypothetical protein
MLGVSCKRNQFYVNDSGQLVCRLNSVSIFSMKKDQCGLFSSFFYWFSNFSSLGNKMFVLLKPGLIHDVPVVIAALAELSHSLFG